MSSNFPALSVQPPQQPDILGTYARLAQIKNAQQQQQLGGLEIQQKQLVVKAQQQAQNDQQTAMQVIQANNGDIDKSLPQLYGKVSPNYWTGLQKAHSEALKSAAELTEVQNRNEATANGQLLGLISQAKQMPPDVYAQSFPQIVAKAIEIQPKLKGQIDPSKPVPQKQLDQLGLGFQSQAQIHQQVADKQAAQDLELKVKSQAETVRHNRATETEAGKEKPTSTEKDFQSFYASWRGAKGLPQNAKNEFQARTDFAQQKATAAAGAGGLNASAMDQAAEKYFQTGQLPAMGMGAAGAATRRQIMNRAGELHPEGNLAANSAAFNANKNSLAKIQTNFDQVSAFENTAGKNLDIFLKQADNITDSGAKFINMPIRMITRNLMGTADMAAFDAARTTALTEISKVLNSANASNVVSDSARQDVERLIGKDATLASIKSAANILKQDMANRHQAYQDQITDIKGRLSASAGNAGSGGKVISQAAIAQAAKDHGVSLDEATKQAKAAGYTIQ